MWEESLHDADKVLERFFHYCHEAGPQCDLHRRGDKTAHAVQERYNSLIKRLADDPITFMHPEHHYPFVFTQSMAQMIVLQSLYAPMRMFPISATLLNQLYIGDTDTFARSLLDLDLRTFCLAPSIPEAYLPGDAQKAIMCTDKDYPVSCLCFVTLTRSRLRMPRELL